MQFDIEATIDCSIEEVFAYAADPKNATEWSARANKRGS